MAISYWKKQSRCYQRTPSTKHGQHVLEKMKVRITPNQIRLRLSPGDVQVLDRGEGLETCLDLGPGGLLAFRLRSSPSHGEIALGLEGSSLEIVVPENEVNTWASTDRIGIEGSVSITDGNSLFVLIEKDLPCEHP